MKLVEVSGELNVATLKKTAYELNYLNNAKEVDIVIIAEHMINIGVSITIEGNTCIQELGPPLKFKETIPEHCSDALYGA